MKRKKTCATCESNDKQTEPDDDLYEDSSEVGEKNLADKKERKSKKRKKRLTPFKLSERIVEKESGKEQNYQPTQITRGWKENVNRGPRVVAEVLNTAWKMKNAQDKLERLKKAQLELLQEAALENYGTECERKWLTCALEVLQQNRICRETFTGSSSPGT